MLDSPRGKNESTSRSGEGGGGPAMWPRIWVTTGRERESGAGIINGMKKKKYCKGILLQGLCSAGGRRRPLRLRQEYNTTKRERDRNRMCMVSWSPRLDNAKSSMGRAVYSVLCCELAGDVTFRLAVRANTTKKDIKYSERVYDSASSSAACGRAPNTNARWHCGCTPLLVVFGKRTRLPSAIGHARDSTTCHEDCTWGA